MVGNLELRGTNDEFLNVKYRIYSDTKEQKSFDYFSRRIYSVDNDDENLKNKMPILCGNSKT
ncbi:hypothetical protein GCM10027035_19080 [Emticicia sediminis]